MPQAILRATVTPFAGVWIEIGDSSMADDIANVTPFAGVWIEIFVILVIQIPKMCHSLRGSVD